MLTVLFVCLSLWQGHLLLWVIMVAAMRLVHKKRDSFGKRISSVSKATLQQGVIWGIFWSRARESSLACNRVTLQVEEAFLPITFIFTKALVRQFMGHLLRKFLKALALYFCLFDKIFKIVKESSIIDKIAEAQHFFPKFRFC